MGDIEMNHTTNVMYFKMEKIDPPNDLLDENYTQISIMQKTVENKIAQA